MSEAVPDLEAAAATLQRIEALTRRLRRQLGDPETVFTRRRRALTLREAALSTLRSDEWMSLGEWEAAMLVAGYRPPANPKRADQTRRSLASLTARNRHRIDADGRGHYRLRELEPTDPLLA